MVFKYFPNAWNTVDICGETMENENPTEAEVTEEFH